MGEKLVVGPINKGLRTDREPFNIDNDSFPVLLNAYQWRGRVKRKRGTSPLTRLERYFDITKVSYNPLSATLTLDASGHINILTGYVSVPPFSLQASGSIVPGTVHITVNGVPYTDPTMDGYLTPTGTGGPNTIDYATGLVTIPAGAGFAVTALTFNYYPQLPVMGLEDLVLSADQFPGTLGFDTVYSYSINSTFDYPSHDVSFYKNPGVDPVLLPGYVPKTDPTPTTWNGQTYQQFWTTNYQNALWATNGMTVPFTSANIGMQYKFVTAVTMIVAGPPATARLTIPLHGLVKGDFLFLNELPLATVTGINLQTCYVINVFDANNVDVEFPKATLGGAGGATATGIAQYLTNRSDVTKDCLRWYDGDPTNGSTTNPLLNKTHGWVNFAPPISNLAEHIDDLPDAQYYLVGAKLIVPYKDRLLFLGPVVQTSVANSQVYLQDTIIYSQNGTPFYNCSFTGDPTLPTTVFSPVLTPDNQSATASAFFDDVPGFGGNITAGFAQPIQSVGNNEDVLIVGFSNKQTRLVYTGNDLIPFNFFVVNSEFGSGSPFSAVTLDRGVITIGDHGIIITSQVGSQRVDLDIPDQVFQFVLKNNGTERICAQRDWINEWIYFSYLDDQNPYIFPNQTLLYNYRDESWGVFNENYTTYGSFRKQTGYTWATVGSVYSTWAAWNAPWSAGASNLEQQIVIAGNQQGYVLTREDEDTSEAPSLSITDTATSVGPITAATNAPSCVLTVNNSFVVGERVTISGVNGMTQLNGNTYTITAATSTTITLNVNSTLFGAFAPSPNSTVASAADIFCRNHCLQNGDYIVIEGCLGTVGTVLNSRIFRVENATTNDFDLSYSGPLTVTGTYFGGGQIVRMYVPFIQTKQFPPSWGMSRKTRIGAQAYLLTRTPEGQMELQIYLSENASNPYTSSIVTPDPLSPNDALIYTDILYTSPEIPVIEIDRQSLGFAGSTTTVNLFLTPPIKAGTVFFNIGNTTATFTDDGVGGFTVTGTGVALGSSIDYNTGAVTLVFSSAPIGLMFIVSYSYYSENVQTPTASEQQQLWHRMNTSLLGDTVQLGFTMNDAQMRDPEFPNQFEEIEIHGFVVDCTPSQMLV